MRVVAIVQARMGSTRLPGKVLEDLAGEPMLVRVVRRVGRARSVDMVVVATTTLPHDDVIAALCAERGWRCFRGAEDDVLDRYYQAARECEAVAVVRVTADCPFIDPDVIDQLVHDFRAARPRPDYASNTLTPRTFPRGLDAEIVSFDALQRAWHEDDDPASREHVTPYIWRHPERFRLHAVYNDCDLSKLRWTVDTAADLEFARVVYEHVGHDRMSWHQVRRLLSDHPNWTEINRGVQQKEIG